jgi:hypothetical protein
MSKLVAINVLFQGTKNPDDRLSDSVELFLQASGDTNENRFQSAKFVGERLASLGDLRLLLSQLSLEIIDEKRLHIRIGRPVCIKDKDTIGFDKNT